MAARRQAGSRHGIGPASAQWSRRRGVGGRGVGREESAQVSLIVLPEDGVTPILSAINKAKTTIDIGIFRLDRADIAKALRAAVDRGVAVRTLIAHTNRGGEKRLRKLELNLLKTGASVRRTDDDLRRGLTTRS